MNNSVILAIDLKSFYASVECVDRGLDPFTTPLVVADIERGKGTIVLAASPYIKTFGVKSRCRLYEVPTDIPNIIYAKPRMKRYLEMSTIVVSIFLDFISQEDLHVYSIDESFLDITRYLKASNKTPMEFADSILKRVFDKTGLTCTCGIGPNLFMAKICMDNEAKHANDFIAQWTYADVPQKLYPLPIEDIWGVGARMEIRLKALGIATVGDMAACSKDLLVRKFGIIGEELYNHAHGLDEAHVQEKIKPNNQSFQVGQVLFEDYTIENARLIVKEMTGDLAFRLRKAKVTAKNVFLMIGYSKEVQGGFCKGTALENSSDDYDELIKGILAIFDFFVEDYPIRRISVSSSEIKSNKIRQFDLFSNPTEIEGKEKLNSALDSIKDKFGMNAIFPLSALKEKSTLKKRHDLIGGHHK